jgi:hypothetical protein
MKLSKIRFVIVGVEVNMFCRLICSNITILNFLNLRPISCLKVVYGPQQHGLMFGSCFLNHDIEMSS